MYSFGVRQLTLLKVLLFTTVLWGASSSTQLAWSQIQLPKTPKPDDVNHFIHVEPKALGEWVQQEFEDLGHILNSTYKDEPSDDEFAYFYDWIDPNSHQADADYQPIDLIFEECRTETDRLAWACEIARLQITIDNYVSCNSSSIFSEAAPTPLGFRIYEDRPWCVIEFATLLRAEGPLMLSENIEWMIEVSHRAKNPTQPEPTLILKGYQNPANWKVTEHRWAQLNQFSTLHLDNIPQISELVTFDRANEKFSLAVDSFAHYRLDPMTLRYDDYYWSEVVFNDTWFTIGVFDCEVPACKQVQLYYWTGTTYDAKLDKPDGPLIAYYPDLEGVALNFMTPERGVSPAFLKALMTRFTNIIRPLSNDTSENDRYSVDEEWWVTAENVIQEELDCWDADNGIPQISFVKKTQDRWAIASSQCPAFELRSGALSVDMSQHLLQGYLNALNDIFDSDAWHRIAAVLFINDPSKDYIGLYSSPNDELLPNIVFNLHLEAGELESQKIFTALVHEFAHQIFYTGALINMYADQASYHPCFNDPEPENCENFSGPVADYLKQFWWDHRDGFGREHIHDEAYSGLYRIIDDSGAFVSEYAATNAHEDFAETFTAAVFDQYPIFNREGKIVSEKLDFFLKDGGPYTELVKQIRSKFHNIFEIWNAKDLYTNMTFTNRLVEEAEEDLLITTAWQNRQMKPINKNRSEGWDFGGFLQKEIEGELSLCQSKATSTKDMISCENRAAEHWDEVLNSEYQFLMTRVQDKEGLRELQRAWIKYRDLKCSWTGHWLGSAGRIAAASCFQQMTLQRTLEIISLNSCFMEEGCLW